MSEALAKALSHPLRVQIFARLGERPGSAKQMADEMDQHLSNTSYHVRRLHELGLVRLVGTVPRRGATERIYEAEPANASGKGKGTRPACIPAALDAEGWKQVSAILKQAAAKITTARDQSAKRLATTDDPGIRTTIVVASFETPKS